MMKLFKKMPNEIMIIYETFSQPAVFLVPGAIIKFDLTDSDYSSFSTYSELRALINNIEIKAALPVKDLGEFYQFLLKFNFWKRKNSDRDLYPYMIKSRYFESLTVKTPFKTHTFKDTGDGFDSEEDKNIYDLFMVRLRMLMLKIENPEEFEKAMNC